MTFKHFICLFFLWLGINQVQASAFVVADVHVEGLQRISPDSFFNYLPVKRGEKITDEDFPDIIRQLYKTGFFKVIDISRDGDILVINVIERPIIGAINIQGSKDIKVADLLKGLATAGLAEGAAFDSARLHEVDKALLELYYTRSKYDVIVDVKTRPLARNRIALDINVKEGISARIKQINIVGNRAFSERALLDLMKLKTQHFFAIFTKSDQYSGEKLSADINRLRSYYLNRGFLDFKIDATHVSLTPDKKYVYITINITEGLPYRVSGVTFSPVKELSQASLHDLLTYGIGSYYSQQKIQISQQNIKARLGDFGYALAQVQIFPNIDKRRQEVSLQYDIHPGKVTYVRRITYRGNHKTNDKILRREMRQIEAAVYNQSKVSRSTQRLRRLENITAAKQKVVPVAGHPDQVDIVYDVAERNNRTFVGSVGYGSSSRLVLSGTYQTRDFLGTGTHFTINVDSSHADRNYALSFTEPYYTVDGVSRTLKFFYNTKDESKHDIGDWQTDNYGAFVYHGFPANEDESFKIGVGYRNTRVKTGQGVASEIGAIIAKNGDTYKELVGDFSWTHDTRDNTFFATSGSITRLSTAIVLPGSTSTYYTLGMRNRSYVGIGDKLIASIRGDVSYGGGYGSTDELPFFRNYYAGGLTTVRGFKTNTLGPRWSNGDIKGGNLRVTGGAELILPVTLGKDRDTVRLGLFADFGNVYDGINDFDVADFRYSAGLYLLWNTPVGPLNLSYGVPLNNKKGDESQRFQFSIGVPF